MADDLYEQDFYAWTQAQAQALRAWPARSNALDFENLAEEIQDVGSEVLHACESWIERIVEHLLKIEFIGTPRDLPHWRKEVYAFRRDLDRRLTTTLRNRLSEELDSIYAASVKSLTLGEVFSGDLAAEAGLGPSYTWEQIVDPDWYPEPRGTGAAS